MRWAIALTLVAIALRLPFVGMAASAPDTVDYLARMESLLAGHGFSDALRTPGLILLLAGFHLLGADPVVGVVVLQNVIACLVIPALVLLLGCRFFNLATGVVAGFLAAASPLLLLSEQFALTDYLFGVLLLLGVASLMESALRAAQGRPATRWLLAAGALFGLATLFRGNGLYLIAAIPIAMLLALRDWRGALRSSGLAIAAMIAVLSPWVIHNIVDFGSPQVTTLGGYALYLRVVDHDRIPPPDDSADGRLARQIYDDTYAFAPPGQELNSGFLLAGALEERGDDNVAATEAMASLALQAIGAHPSTYLSNTWDILREYRDMYDPGHELVPGMDDEQLVRYRLSSPSEVTLHGRGALPGDSILTRAPWHLAEALGRLVYLLSIGGLAAFALPFLGSRRSRIAASVLLPTAVLGMLVGALSVHFEPRYGLPYAWMTWLLMSAAAVGLVRLGARRLVAAGRGALSSDFVRRVRFPDG